MAQQVKSDPSAIQARIDGPPKNVSAADYMAHYAHDFYEWVDGELIKMAPVHLKHDQLASYLRLMLEAYLALRPVGRVIAAPFVLRLDATRSYREPDLQVILNDNPGQFTVTAMIGPADICIEIVSPESVKRDHGKKRDEYEKAGVREYWLIDPVRGTANFYRLEDSGKYVEVEPDQDGNYQTPILPGLRLHVPTLWEDRLPDIYEVTEAVRAMLKGD